MSAGTGGLASYLSTPEWVAMCSLGTRCRMEADYQLFHQGDEGDHAYVILRGAVKVVRGEPVGKSAILTIRGAGDVVGDLAVMDGGPRSGTVSTLTPMVVRVVPGASFKRFIERPSVTAAYARYTVNRLRQSDVQRTEIAVLPVRQRLARALLRLYVTADAAGSQRAFDLPQQDLAELIGASRNAVVLALGVLRAEGVIDTHRMRVSILDVDALHRMAG
ncbi:transcriptional regulator [Micromonospora sagamiensis]|uniref:CRP-like cAMP-binding protein n=2 Tax=Micromonospora sagamiensis TaxID=47875 RepID=A0A562WC29_9ACTN|nr:CRP-like cAMP-binding protein [Micromonospora sagamiensis]BCL13272.1 transcriptional regulator [Micromonospora sagamiensis]